MSCFGLGNWRKYGAVSYSFSFTKDLWTANSSIFFSLFQEHNIVLTVPLNLWMEGFTAEMERLYVQWKFNILPILTATTGLRKRKGRFSGNNYLFYYFFVRNWISNNSVVCQNNGTPEYTYIFFWKMLMV